MKVFRWLLFFAGLAFFVSACSALKSDQTYPAPGQGPQGIPNPAEGVYPPAAWTPSSPGGAPYPGVLYPNLQDGDEIYWSQAVAMILNGEVARVMQSHSLKVTITLKDGRSFVTYEPVIDEVIRVIESCGDKCADILIATE